MKYSKWLREYRKGTVQRVITNHYLRDGGRDVLINWGGGGSQLNEILWKATIILETDFEISDSCDS